MNKVYYVVQIVDVEEFIFVAVLHGPKGLMIDQAFHQSYPNARFPTKELVQKFLETFCKDNDCIIIVTEEVLI